MRIKSFLALCLATACTASHAQGDDKLEQSMLNECQVLAKEINKAKKVGISTKDMSPLFTWRAACAERPPTGAGNVTALCEGKRRTVKGEEGIFFWQKSNKGKLENGYFLCEG
jgi:hypothetical protein